AEVVGKDVGGAAAVSAMDYDDFLVRQLDAGVVLGDTRVVPVLNLLQVDVSQYFRAEAEVGDAGHIVDGHHCAEHDGNVNDLDFGGGQLIVGHRSVRGSEVDEAGRN